MARAAVNDPLKVFRFRISIDGFVRLGFSEATGLMSHKTDVAEYREGGMNDTKQKSAGLTNFDDIVLKRGQLVRSTRGGDLDFINWVRQVFRVSNQGNAANYRRDLDVEQFSASNQRVAVWRVYEAWPSAQKGMSDLNATSSDNSFEEITLTNEGNDRIL